MIQPQMNIPYLKTHSLSKSYPFPNTLNKRIVLWYCGLMAPKHYLLKRADLLQAPQILVFVPVLPFIFPFMMAAILPRFPFLHNFLDNESLVPIRYFDFFAYQLPTSKVHFWGAIYKELNLSILELFRHLGHCDCLPDDTSGAQYLEEAFTGPSWWMRHGSRFGVHGEDPAFVEDGILSILVGVIQIILQNGESQARGRNTRRVSTSVVECGRNG